MTCCSTGEDYYSPAFLGYVPDGEVPGESLKDILDWERILYKTAEVPR
jgi:hypothetical protein